MERQIRQTADGSHTIEVPGMQVTYHSTHGAIQESRQVFIQAGLQYMLAKVKDEPLCIFEMGFGTGLNALLTLQESLTYDRNIYYQSAELYPLSPDEVKQLNYPVLVDDEHAFASLHSALWNADVRINDLFTLHKSAASILEVKMQSKFHLVYYDAFAPGAQPELWTEDIFRFLYDNMYDDAVLVTYCSKGDVRRAMMAAGFSIEKIPGPPGKREMVRALKK